MDCVDEFYEVAAFHEMIRSGLTDSQWGSLSQSADDSRIIRHELPYYLPGGALGQHALPDQSFFA